MKENYMVTNGMDENLGEFNTLNEAYDRLTQYIAEDLQDGTYEPNYYAIDKGYRQVYIDNAGIDDATAEENQMIQCLQLFENHEMAPMFKYNNYVSYRTGEFYYDLLLDDIKEKVMSQPDFASDIEDEEGLIEYECDLELRCGDLIHCTGVLDRGIEWVDFTIEEVK